MLGLTGHRLNCQREIVMVIRRTAQWREGPSERVRVLIEDPAAEWFEDFVRYRAFGLEVAACSGPDSGGAVCPYLRGRHCVLWDEADVVVFALPRHEPAGRLVLKAGRRAHPGKPIVYEACSGSIDGGSAEVVPSATTRISAVLAALRGESRPGDTGAE